MVASVDPRAAGVHRRPWVAAAKRVIRDDEHVEPARPVEVDELRAASGRRRSRSSGRAARRGAGCLHDHVPSVARPLWSMGNVWRQSGRGAVGRPAGSVELRARPSSARTRRGDLVPDGAHLARARPAGSRSSQSTCCVPGSTGQSSPQPIVTTTSAHSASLRRAPWGVRPREIDAQLAHRRVHFLVDAVSPASFPPTAPRAAHPPPGRRTAPRPSASARRSGRRRTARRPRALLRRDGSANSDPQTAEHARYEP